MSGLPAQEGLRGPCFDTAPSVTYLSSRESSESHGDGKLWFHSLISDARDVVDKQPLLVFFLLEEHHQSVADIEDTKRP